VCPQDVSRFCSELAHIYSQISKPIFDIVLMSVQLYLLNRSRAGNATVRAAAERRCAVERSD
jgi:hypothetical protein